MRGGINSRFDKKSFILPLFFNIIDWMACNTLQTGSSKGTSESPSGKRPCFCLVVRLVDRLGRECLLMSRFRPSRSTQLATHQNKPAHLHIKASILLYIQNRIFG